MWNWLSKNAVKADTLVAFERRLDATQIKIWKKSNFSPIAGQVSKPIPETEERITAADNLDKKAHVCIQNSPLYHRQSYEQTSQLAEFSCQAS